MTRPERETFEVVTRETVIAFSAAWDACDVDGLLALMSEAPIYRGSTGAGPGTEYVGREAVRAAFTNMLGSTPVVPDDQAANSPPEMYFFGNRALVHWQLQLPTESGELVDVPGVDVLTFDRNGLIEEKNAFRKAFS